MTHLAGEWQVAKYPYNQQLLNLANENIHKQIDGWPGVHGVTRILFSMKKLHACMNATDNVELRIQ